MQIVSFLVSMILARLLSPDDYGVIAIVWIFLNICNVFVINGWCDGLIRKTDANDTDFSTIFYFSFLIAVILYIGLFVAAPYIARWYEAEILASLLRVMGLRLLIGAVNSVQRAKVKRDMDFQKFFFSTLVGTVISAVVGIWLALSGYGVWALVAQELTNVTVDTLVLFVTIKWYPRLLFSMESLKQQVAYGGKIVASLLVDVIYDETQSMYAGKLYSTQTLGYYTRGRQFPRLISDNVNVMFSSVLFPAISSVQGNLEDVKNMTRRSMRICSYVLSPVMLGLAAVAEPLIQLLLTEKWLPCVPYVQIFCVASMLQPLQTANLQAIYALGRSDVGLWLNVVKKTLSLLLVLAFARISVEAMAWAGVAAGILGLVVNIAPNKKLLEYSIREQLMDLFPSWLLAGVMVALVRMISKLGLPIFLELVMMVLMGMFSYVALSVLFRMEAFEYLWEMVRAGLSRVRKN